MALYSLIVLMCRTHSLTHSERSRSWSRYIWIYTL